MAKDKQVQPGNYTGSQADIKRFEIDGRPIFESLNIDDMTGEVSYKLNPDIEEDLKAAQQGAAQNIAAVIERMITGNPPYEQLQKWQTMLDAFYTETKDGEAFVDELRGLRKYIDAEINSGKYEDIKAKAGEKQYTLSELLDLLADPNSEFAPVLEAARAAKQKAEASRIQRAEQVEYPLDKPNQRIWNLLENATGGQITFDMNPAKFTAGAIYSINFDELDNDLTITKRLTAFDKRVYIAAAALFNAGNNVISLTQIYYAMGYTGTPGENDREKINDSITKMTLARILLDNQIEAEQTKYEHFKYDGSLLPFERVTAIINGKKTDTAINMFREPPLMTFAKERGQVTTIDIKLLQSPVSKTDTALKIEDYLIERISRAKRYDKDKPVRILYKTLYGRTNITDKKQRQRALAKVKKYLDYYRKQNYIASYIEDADGVTVLF